MLEGRWLGTVAADGGARHFAIVPAYVGQKAQEVPLGCSASVAILSMRTSVWRWPARLLLAIWFLVACGGSTEPAVETSADPGLPVPDSSEEKSDDPPSTATPSPAALEPGPVEILTASADGDAGMKALSTFTLLHDPNLNCLYHDEPDNNGEPGTGGRVAVVWPFGFTAVADEGGVVVFDEAGTPVARTGHAFQIGGGGLPADSDHCQAIGVWVANGSPITPLPEIDSLSVEYEACLQDLGFEPGGVQVLVDENGRPWWVKTGNGVPADLHGPCIEQIGGRSNGLSSHGKNSGE